MYAVLFLIAFAAPPSPADHWQAWTYAGQHAVYVSGRVSTPEGHRPRLTQIPDPFGRLSLQLRFVKIRGGVESDDSLPPRDWRNARWRSRTMFKQVLITYPSGKVLTIQAEAAEPQE